MLALTLAGCVSAGAPERARVDQAALLAPSGRGDLIATATRADRAWDERDDVARLAEALEIYARAVTLPSPGLEPPARQRRLRQLYVRLARGHHLMATTHLSLEQLEPADAPAEGDQAATDSPPEDDDDGPRRAEVRRAQREHLRRGLDAARRALALVDPELLAPIEAGGAQLERTLAEVPEAAHEPMYWYASLMLHDGLARGAAALLHHKKRMLPLLEHLAEHTPTYFHAAPLRDLGTLRTRVPLSGGAPRKSEAAFARSLELAPNYGMTRVRYASHHAVLIQDRLLFERQLQMVLATPADVVPELRPENELAHRYARALLGQTDELFF